MWSLRNDPDCADDELYGVLESWWWANPEGDTAIYDAYDDALFDGGRGRCEDSWADELESHWDVIEAVAGLILAGEPVTNDVVRLLFEGGTGGRGACEHGALN